MKVFTIGFTKKTAADFFGALKEAGIKRLIDVRLHNVSQLAGFAKRDDLKYFLQAICNAEYIHEPRLAPSEGLFNFYKKDDGSWDEYERRFLALLADRHIETKLERSFFAGPSVLLCSEPTAENCHRRLVLEYLKSKWGALEMVHL